MKSGLIKVVVPFILVAILIIPAITVGVSADDTYGSGSYYSQYYYATISYGNYRLSSDPYKVFSKIESNEDMDLRGLYTKLLVSGSTALQGAPRYYYNCSPSEMNKGYDDPWSSPLYSSATFSFSNVVVLHAKSFNSYFFAYDTCPEPEYEINEFVIDHKLLSDNNPSICGVCSNSAYYQASYSDS